MALANCGGKKQSTWSDFLVVRHSYWDQMLVGGEFVCDCVSPLGILEKSVGRKRIERSAL